jgi:segregation and condensation protein A
VGYTVNIEHFEGPLDLLLQLVEKDELEISKLSLASVAEQFIKYMQSKTVLPEEMADFLVVASKLVYYKSKLLLPGFSDQEMEEGPDLESQLRQYQMFVTAAKEIDQIWKSGNQSFSRSQTVVRRIREVKFAPPENASLDIMSEIMKRIIARIEPIVRLPKVAIRKAISLHERIKDLFSRIHAHASISFKTYIKDIKHREDAIVSFLALLELVKQRFVMVEQIDLFNDISISAHPEAPERDPLVESFA